MSKERNWLKIFNTYFNISIAILLVLAGYLFTNLLFNIMGWIK